MSSYGFPDGQEITQWLGQPIDEASAYAIGAGSKAIGPAVLANFASIIVAIKPTGGQVTVTLDQQINGGPAGLKLSQSVVVPAGSQLFEAFVLFADQVTVTLQGAVGGTTVDYAVYPSNTTTNAQVIQSASITIQHNEVAVASEPAVDFVDAGANVFTVTDDAANTRIKVTPPKVLTGIVNGAGAIAGGSGFAVARNSVGNYTVTYNVAFGAPPAVVVQAVDSGFGAHFPVIYAETAAGFSVALENSAGTLFDQGWNFLAFAVA